VFGGTINVAQSNPDHFKAKADDELMTKLYEPSYPCDIQMSSP